jgi:peptide/nickel transport system ATP-binding protein/oligopeptide transport system ATP-binding protein
MSALPVELLRVEELTKHFPVQKNFFEKLVFRNNRFRLINQTVHAVNGVSFQIARGETLGLVGESGCGKSTLAKTILGLKPLTSGRIWFEGQEIGMLRGAARGRYQKQIQMVFQDPFSSLNPRKKVIEIIGLPMLVHGVSSFTERQKQVIQLLNKVGLESSCVERYPHQFSGGQRQRIGIARALACKPKLLIADEPLSALDVSIQAQILNLLMDLQEEYELTYLLVSHDLSVVKHISTRVAVMYLGYIVEMAATEAIYSRPLHPYTQLLFSAIPSLDHLEFTDVMLREGEVPTPIDLPTGCPFHPRCQYVMDVCREIRPIMKKQDHDRLVACHLFVSK